MLVYDVKLWTKKDSDTSFSGGYVVFFCGRVVESSANLFFLVNGSLIVENKRSKNT